VSLPLCPTKVKFRKHYEEIAPLSGIGGKSRRGKEVMKFQKKLIINNL
jgi:hypothetical protein